MAARLREIDPGVSVELVEITTRGDRQQSAPSPAAPVGKGAFIEALEEAMLDGTADLAVHSMKDVPGSVPEAFTVTSFGPRGDVRDALLTPPVAAPGGVGALPPGARVGTSSGRRRALLAALRRDFDVAPVRGNVDTRLRRLDDGDFDALILACAGLDRLGLGARISQRIAASVLVPAPGQGALAVEFPVQRADLGKLLAAGAEPAVERCVVAERQVSRRLGADCAMPLGAYCRDQRQDPHGGELRLTVVVADAGGERLLRVDLAGSDPLALGDAAAARLGKLGVGELLAN